MNIYAQLFRFKLVDIDDFSNAFDNAKPLSSFSENARLHL